jgi:hypothetical protein
VLGDVGENLSSIPLNLRILIFKAVEYSREYFT